MNRVRSQSALACWGRIAWGGCFGLWMVGCGGGSPAPAPKVVAPSAAKQAAPGAVPTAGGAQAKTARPGDAAGKKGGDKPVTNTAANRNPQVMFPSEPPTDVFVAGEVGTPMVGNPSPSFDDQDRMLVATGNTVADSSQFQSGSLAAVSERQAKAGFVLPAGFTMASEFGYTDDGYPARIRSDQDGKLMAFVKGGATKVGSRQGPDEVQPEFMTFLDPYYMDVTEVTLGEFDRFRQSQRDSKKRPAPPPVNASQGSRYPVLGISWGDAQAYLKWAGKELPTEAEFERAARGPEGFPHPWGLGRPVWPNVRDVSTISAVGQFPGDQSPDGIYDLAGNAREWLHDWYSPQSHAEAAQQAAQRTLANWGGAKRPATGSKRVVKGAGPGWEVWYRKGADMHEQLPDVGFRGVLRIPPPSTTAAN